MNQILRNSDFSRLSEFTKFFKEIKPLSNNFDPCPDALIFKNPFNSKFCFDIINGTHCDINYIKDLVKGLKVYYPNYNEKTSTQCDNLVGWVLITNDEIFSKNLIRADI
jgi:hypothetical protein